VVAASISRSKTGWPDELAKKSPNHFLSKLIHNWHHKSSYFKPLPAHPKWTIAHLAENSPNLVTLKSITTGPVLYLFVGPPSWTVHRRIKGTLCFWARMDWRTLAGWPDWANFRPLDNYLFWAAFWKLLKIFGYFFPLFKVLTKKMVWAIYILGDFSPTHLVTLAQLSNQ
jgi:hypothetical protein